MAIGDPFKRLSSAPTNPHPPAVARAFDVADLYRGPIPEQLDAQPDALPVDEKLRQAIGSPWLAGVFPETSSELSRGGDRETGRMTRRTNRP